MKTKQKFDIVTFIMDYEEGNLDDEQVLEGFQYLVDNNLIRQLQGHYQRMAINLIENGFICGVKNAEK